MSAATTQTPDYPFETQAMTATPATAFDDGWDHEPLPVRPVRRWLGPLTMLLGGLLLATTAFAGGVIAEKSIVKVATTPQSQISISAQGSVTAIKPGDNLAVSGATGADGTITAANVRDSGTGQTTSAGGTTNAASAG